jgi:hypothetical protein
MFGATICLVIAQTVGGQSIQLPWSGFAHTPQHDCVSMVPSQPLNRVLWTMPLIQGTFNDGKYNPYTHFSGPVVTRSNTVIFPMNLTNDGYNFRIEALAGATGQTNWEQATDFTGLTTAIPVCPLALTPANRLFFAGAGGTVLYSDTPDAPGPPSFTRAAFYGLSQYLTNSNSYNARIFICTPITSDRYGDIFFGFQTIAETPPIGTQGGLARIDYNGTGSWVGAAAVVGSIDPYQPVVNSAPALSVDQKTVYIAFTYGPYVPSYLVALDSRTLAPLASVPLIDPETSTNVNQFSDSTASPTVGPDGDVYFGVLGNPDTDNDSRGWLLHFDSTLSVAKTPGLFGWDVTDSIVSASLVPSYQGNSKYLLATKYNNYTTKQYSMAILDPQQGALDTASGVTVMAAVLTIQSPNPKEWCINSAAVDPFSKSVLANDEDGYLYRWDLTGNQLIESIELTTSQTGQAYTPTVIGVDGIVYAINRGVLFAVGK